MVYASLKEALSWQICAYYPLWNKLNLQVYVLSRFSHVWLSATLRTKAH